MRVERLLFLLACAPLCAATATAATITVSKGGAISTIQAGVDTASAGDTVKVEAGVYQENVVIDAGKTGLRLVGTGKVVIDARPPGGAAAGPGIEVDANEVKITNITVQNATNDGGPPNGSGFRITGDDFSAKKCVALACEPSGFELIGADKVRMKKCSARGGLTGFKIADASDVVLSKCVVRGVSERGIDLADCAGFSLRGCKIAATDDEGLFAAEGTTSDVTLSKSVFDLCESQVVDLDGNTVPIQRVSVTGCKFTTCAEGLAFSHVIDGRFRGNRIERIDDDDNGVNVDECTDFVLEDNTIRAIALTAIDCDGGSGIEVRDNDVRDCAFTTDPAFTIGSDDVVVERNRVRNCVGAAFSVEGDDGDLLDNQVVNGANDGIFVAATANGTRLLGNLVRKCIAEGLDHRGTNSIIRDNVFAKCRIDLTNEGTAQFDDNQFKTGGETAPHEID